MPCLVLVGLGSVQLKQQGLNIIVTQCTLGVGELLAWFLNKGRGLELLSPQYRSIRFNNNIRLIVLETVKGGAAVD